MFKQQYSLKTVKRKLDWNCSWTRRKELGWWFFFHCLINPLFHNKHPCINSWFIWSCATIPSVWCYSDQHPTARWTSLTQKWPPAVTLKMPECLEKNQHLILYFAETYYTRIYYSVYPSSTYHSIRIETIINIATSFCW